MADLLVLPRPAKSVQNGQALAEKLKHTGPAETVRVASVPQRKQLLRSPVFSFSVSFLLPLSCPCLHPHSSSLDER